MQSALLFSMNPIPPMSAAELKYNLDTFGGAEALSFSRRSSERFSNPFCHLVPLITGLHVDGAG